MQSPNKIVTLFCTLLTSTTLAALDALSIVMIKGKWYPSKANYIFGPDMSELDACSLAENRAKTKVMRTIIPETLKSENNLKCDLTSPKKSCRVVLIDAEVSGYGKQQIRMLSCDWEECENG